MKKQKKQLMKYGVGIVIFCGVFVATTVAIKAATIGWLWGGSEEQSDGNQNNGNSGYETGLGWISMSRTNCDTNDNGTIDASEFTANSNCPTTGTGVASYGITIPDSSCSGTGCDLIGYAWSGNLGWIAFDNSNGYLTGCPAGNGACSARRVGNNLEGWARFTSIKDALIAGNSGGWEGWIRLNESGRYGVDITKMDGTGANHTYAWSGTPPNGNAELGWIDFGRAIMPVQPTVDLDANPLTINIDTNPLPYATNLTWLSTNATSCAASTLPDAGLWTGSKATVSSGLGDAITIDSSHLAENFTLTCAGPGGTANETVNVTTGCNRKECSGTTCATTFMATGTADNAACVAASNCSTDSDCAPRSGEGWKEVPL